MTTLNAKDFASIQERILRVEDKERLNNLKKYLLTCELDRKKINEVNRYVDTNFIKNTAGNNSAYHRMCLQARRSMKKNKVDYEIMTPSQLRLLKDEITRLENLAIEEDNYRDRGLLAYLNKVLYEYKLVDSNPFFEGDINKQIDYGTSFSIQITYLNKTINKRVEMIERALSNETTDRYIERIGTIGYRVMNLFEGESFYIENPNIYGIVYDVDNTPFEERFITNDPVLYKNMKRS